MKEPNDSLMAGFWNDEPVVDPYETIDRFFDLSDLDAYRKMIKNMVFAACSEKAYKSTTPGILLHDFKKIASVIEAAHILNGKVGNKSWEIKEGDLFKDKYFYGRHTYLAKWYHFPRFLSKKEYKNPFLVFEKFFKYQGLEKWKEDLQHVLEYSIAGCAIHEFAKVNVLAVYLHLTKLVEAIHLIDVREIEPDRKAPKAD